MHQFVHIPKVAGSAFNEIIKENQDKLSYIPHMRVVDIKKLAFVRNPYDRIVSAYFYLKGGGGGTELDMGYKDIVDVYANFKEFVLSISKDALHERIVHLRPMSYFLCDDKGNIVVDRVFKVEDVDAIDSFLSEIGVSARLSETRVNESGHGSSVNYLDKEIVESINSVYRTDFDLFSYQML